MAKFAQLPGKSRERPHEKRESDCRGSYELTSQAKTHAPFLRHHFLDDLRWFDACEFLIQTLEREIESVVIETQ